MRKSMLRELMRSCYRAMSSLRRVSRVPWRAWPAEAASRAAEHATRRRLHDGAISIPARDRTLLRLPARHARYGRPRGARTKRASWCKGRCTPLIKAIITHERDSNAARWPGAPLPHTGLVCPGELPPSIGVTHRPQPYSPDHLQLNSRYFFGEALLYRFLLLSYRCDTNRTGRDNVA
jgi:hypothetical protein